MDGIDLALRDLSMTRLVLLFEVVYSFLYEIVLLLEFILAYLHQQCVISFVNELVKFTPDCVLQASVYRGIEVPRAW